MPLHFQSTQIVNIMRDGENPFQLGLGMLLPARSHRQTSEFPQTERSSGSKPDKDLNLTYPETPHNLDASNKENATLDIIVVVFVGGQNLFLRCSQ